MKDFFFESIKVPIELLQWGDPLLQWGEEVTGEEVTAEEVTGEEVTAEEVHGPPPRGADVVQGCRHAGSLCHKVFFSKSFSP